jgi:hypothetical protein
MPSGERASFLRENLMNRFQPFIGRVVMRERCDEAALLETTGITPRYLPDVFDELDEMEFTLPLKGEKGLVFSAVLEAGRIQRILLGWVGPDDPEDFMRPLDEAGIGEALEITGDALIRFLEAVTG